MENLIYARDWDRIPEKTWSGTAYNLRKALSSKYNIIDCKLHKYSLWDYLAKLKIVKKDCSLHTVLYNRRSKNSFIQKNDYPIFQFGEIFKKENSYLFIDLCVDFLRDMCEKNDPDFIYSGFQKMPLYNLEKRAIEQNDYMKNYCTHIFTMGNWQKDYLINQLGIPENKVSAVGGGINIDSSKIDYSEKTGNKILFIGRDFKRKGGELLVNAFVQLKNELPDVQLYIAGPSQNPINENINGIHFLNDIPSSELYKYYNLCDIFCMPSYFEAYGLVFAEALCYGLPCIGRNAYEMKYFITENENGYLLKKDEPTELAGLLRKALENQNMSKFVKNKKDEYLNKYSWDSVANRCFEKMK